MKNLILKLFLLIFLGAIPHTYSQGGGGSDASGGGNGLESRLIRARTLAISALSSIEPASIQNSAMPDELESYYALFRDALLQDLEATPYQIYRTSQEVKDSNAFIIHNEEKTFVTIHRPQALVLINFPMYEKLNLHIKETAMLWVRESARHLGIQADQDLVVLEETSSWIFDFYEKTHPNNILLQNSFEPIPFKELQWNKDHFYFYEDFFHYYIDDTQFSEEEFSLIHHAIDKFEVFLWDIGLPVSFQFRGISDTWDPKDGINVIQKAALEGNKTNLTHTAVASRTTVTMDIRLDTEISSKPRVESSWLGLTSERFPCICETLSSSLFHALGIDPEYVQKNTTEPQTHKHFEFYKLITQQQRDFIRKIFTPNVMIVKRPHHEALLETTLYTLYAIDQGLMLRLNPNFLKKISQSSNTLGIQVDEKIYKWGVDRWANDKTHVYHRIDLNTFPSKSIILSIDSRKLDPMTVPFSGGSFTAIQLEDKSAFQKSTSIQITLLNPNDLSTYHVSDVIQIPSLIELDR